MKKDLQALFADNEGPDQHAQMCMLIRTSVVNANQTNGSICRPESEKSARTVYGHADLNSFCLTYM